MLIEYAEIKKIIDTKYAAEIGKYEIIGWRGDKANYAAGDKMLEEWSAREELKTICCEPVTCAWTIYKHGAAYYMPGIDTPHEFFADMQISIVGGSMAHYGEAIGTMLISNAICIASFDATKISELKKA